MDQLPFAQACENNKAAILEVLGRYFAEPARILEIGAGTGQHAEHFARHLPHLSWWPSDRTGFHEMCRPRIDQAGLSNLAAPLALDVLDDPWPVTSADGVFSANTAHIMAWPAVEAMFKGVGRLLQPGGYFCLYGPFNVDGQHTSAGNARFDAQLRSKGRGMAIRNREDLEQLADGCGLAQIHYHAMPANNQLLVWQRTR